MPSYSEQMKARMNPGTEYENDVRHVRNWHGKTRIYVYNLAIGSTAASDGLCVVGVLPAGRGRLLVDLSYATFTGITGTVSMGHLGYTDTSAPTPGAVPADATAISAAVTITADELTEFGDADDVMGWAYESLEDIQITLTTSTNPPANSTIKGRLIYILD